MVKLVEVGPRDGLQNEPQSLSLSTKVEFIDRLGQAGVQHIEAGAFVSPKAVPQMVETAAVFRRIQRRSGVTYAALIPNMRGFEQACEVTADEVAVFAAASESFSQRNINCSIAQSLVRFAPVCQAAKAQGMPVRAYVSCVCACPYEGEIAPSAVARLVERLLALGCYEISLGDTIGVGTAGQVRKLLQTLESVAPSDQLAVHFHDTYGQALANILVALEQDIRVIDSAVAGLGGCPYAPGASGNVASEDVVYLLQGLGMPCGVDLEKLNQAGWFIASALGRSTGSKVGAALGKSI